jgi:hypothetical protein
VAQRTDPFGSDVYITCKRKETAMKDWEKVEAGCRKALRGGGGVYRPVKV